MDVYTNIAEAAPGVLDNLARILELRATDPQQVAMRSLYQADLALRRGMALLEVGCGTGAVSRALAMDHPDCSVTGIDPSAFFLGTARRLSSGASNLTFEEASAYALPFDAARFDAVLFHTTLCHIPKPEQALAEAYRVLRPGGKLLVFDADYSSTTVAIAPAAVEAIVFDPYLVQKLVPLVRIAGFALQRFCSHGYQAVTDPTYMLTIVERGADALASADRIGADLAAALKAEASRRAKTGTFFGHLSYASVTATR